MAPGYQKCMREMALAAVEWIDKRGTDGLAFTLPPDDGVMFIAPLSCAAIEMLAPNETSREFLRMLDRATNDEGTAHQACMIVRAMGLPVTDWSEEFWRGLLARGAALVNGGGGGMVS